MLRISKTFVLRCAEVYERHRGRRSRLTERELKAWLRRRRPPKHLNKERFVRLAVWKSRGQKQAYLENDDRLVAQATRQAYRAPNDLLKLHILTALKGVDVTVAAAILHFFYPGRFAVFDLHARKTLRKAGVWQRSVGDDSVAAWQEYVRITRRLAKRLGVTLRTLDKALNARDRWPGECRRALPHRLAARRARR